MKRYAGDAAAMLGLVVCFAAYLWLFLPLVPGDGPMFANDYGLHLPNLLAGYYHGVVNGPLSVPWFNPAQCGGVPFVADLNVAFYSLPQALTFVIDPAAAVRVTFAVFAALGTAGFYVLLRSRFGLSPWAAATGAVLFLFNGFFVTRMLVGHLTFHPFVLTPWIAWAVLLPARPGAAWTWRRAVLAIVLVGAIFAYQFHAGMMHIIVPVALAVGVIAVVHGHLRGYAWQPWALLGLGVVLSLGLSAQRLVAAIAFLEAFPRTLYPLPGLASFGDAITVAVLSLFWHPPTGVAGAALKNANWPHEWHEWAYGVGPAALALLVVAGAVLLARLLVGRVVHRPLSALVVLVAIVVAVTVPVALNVYSPGWNGFLKDLPVIGQSVTLARWFVLFIPLVVLAAALAVDRLAPSRRWAGVLFVMVAISTVWWTSTESHEVRRSYNGGAMVRAWHQATVTGIPPITEVRGELQTDAVLGLADRNNAMVHGFSQIYCYQPMFGYWLESFPAKELRPGPILGTTPSGNLNFKNPACYLFPGANSCAPGDAFRQDQREDLLLFAAYRDFSFARPAIQTAADWINLVALIGGLLVALIALFARRRTG